MTRQEEIDTLRGLLEILENSNPIHPDEIDAEIERLRAIIDRAENQKGDAAE